MIPTTATGTLRLHTESRISLTSSGAILPVSPEAKYTESV